MGLILRVMLEEKYTRRARDVSQGICRCCRLAICASGNSTWITALLRSVFSLLVAVLGRKELPLPQPMPILLLVYEKNDYGLLNQTASRQSKTHVSL